jgi:hypothetical protein
MRRAYLGPFFVLSLLGCAADQSQMNVRAANENQSARSEAERAFFARGYRPLNPPPPMKMLTLRGVNMGCTTQTGRAATDSVEIQLGDTSGTTTFEAACALASGRQNHLSVKLGSDATETLLTQIPQGSAFATAASGKITRYLLAGQVKENRRGFAKGVSCCCDMPPPPPPDATFEVVVGIYPATEEVVVPYDTVIVTFCDQSAPQ